MIGQTLSHYRIVEKVGAGGMGEVYKAHDERLDRDVAIKVLPSGTLADEHARKRIRKEAQALSKLNHPNIATVHDFDTQEGVDFIVMELVKGASLAEKVKTGPLPEKEISELGAQIADALEEAHESGIVHRDLKPGNVAVTPKGRVKVLDFGLAKMLRPVSDEATTEALTQEHAVAGTLPYMSPEELRGEKADHRSDLFSFGVVLYEMATGRRPFEHKLSTALADAIIHKPPEPPSTRNRKVLPGLESIIIKALDKEPEHRYQSAREMRVDLERLSAPVSGLFTKQKRVRAARWLWAAACVAAVVAFVFLLNVGGLRDRLVGEPGPRIDSIAVLPLENLSGDPEQEYFSDGMTEELIAELAKIAALRVISRQSVMQFKDTDTPLPEIAQALNVDALVEGSVRRSGDRVRITTQLVQANPERHLWAESYERDLRDILALQSEVAQAIAREIRITVTPEEEARLARARPVNPEAHDAYLKGSVHWDKLTREDLDTAESYFELALEKDPTYAPAYAGLATVWAARQQMGLTAPHEAGPKAKALALQAIALDDSSAIAHHALAAVRTWTDWDWAGAEPEWRRALELDPNRANTHAYFAHFLAIMGRVDEAIPHSERALELDPFNALFRGMYTRVLYNARRYDDAIAAARTALAMQPGLPVGPGSLQDVLISKGMRDELLAFQRNWFAGDPELVGAFEQGLAEAGYEGAQRRIAGLLAARYEKSGRGRMPSIARHYFYAGDYDRAIEWLEKAYEVHDPGLPYVGFSPIYDPLRSDPRFQDLLRRMNFPE